MRMIKCFTCNSEISMEETVIVATSLDTLGEHTMELAGQLSFPVCNVGV